jgi:putrescine transport system substrate-binding protein
MWGTTGIGYNVDKVKAAFGNTDVASSLDIVFKPENIARLKNCGVTFVDTPDDLIPLALNYLGEDPNSEDPAVIEKVLPLLKAVRPYLTNFHSSQYIDGLANGDTCLAIGYSGDVVQARDRAAEAGNGVNIAYAIPKEGAPLWFDMLAIPKDARHVDEAHAYINYLLDPQVMANNSNYIAYPNAVPKAKELMSKEITGDPTIYPPAEVEARLFTLKVRSPQVNDLYTRIWTELKTGK